MRIYKLEHKDYNGELTFGLPFPYNQLEGEKKINELFSEMKPWKHCIPYYKNSKFAFVSLDALVTFLNNGNLTEQERQEINDNFYIKTFNLTTWSSGLSKFMCTYFDDEIDSSIEIIHIEDILNTEVNEVIQDMVPKSDIRQTKDDYYSNIKTYY